MSLKSNYIIFSLAILLTIITKMVSPVFYIVVIIYLLMILKIRNYRFLLGSIILVILTSLFLPIPTPLKDNIVSGQVEKVDEDYFVLKIDYHKVKVYGDIENLDVNDYLKVSLLYTEIKLPTNDNAFNYRNYLYSTNIFNQAKLLQVITHEKHQSLFYYLNKRINANEDIKSFASLFILGIKDEQMKDYYLQLTNLSIVHLFALSGMHLHLLKKWLENIFKFIVPKQYLNYVSLFIIGVYIYIIPYNISFLRAYLCMLGYTLFKRWFNQLDILSILSVIMLFYNPYLIFNISFIFSYFVYFLVLIINQHHLSKYYLYIGTIPIVLCINYKINIISLLLSIILMPFIEFIYQGLLFYVLLGNMIVPIIKLILLLFNNMIIFANDFSYYLYFTKPTLFMMLGYYFYYLKGILLLNQNRSVSKIVIKLVSILLMFYLSPNYNLTGKVVMIDVGQGDCFLIKQPFNQGNVLIDTGGLRYSDLATTTLIPYLLSEGISQLDYVFISHNDYDHCGALESLNDNFKIKQIIREYHESIKIGNIEFKMLTTDKVYEDENDNSLIIQANINHLNYLFTGDISSTVEKDLYDKYHTLNVDVLKVSHHGSQTGSSNYLFRMIEPKIALISVGKNNIYRHPSNEVIKRLKSNGIKIYRTDYNGMVKIVYYGDDNYVYQ